ncbi:MAG: hypothetical protein JO113_05490 [Candidatus Eremiobacteraeota bacterium]|nr:hypothetical protein [Candidatus Eremiobacteraeota bacterium]
MTAGTIALDVDAYESRLGILDLLSAAFTVPAYAADPMDGDRIQTKWQLTSGRAANPWWNKMNFCITVWRLQALMSRGQFANVDLSGTLQVPLPDDVSRQVLRYYDAVQQLRSAHAPNPALLQLLFWIVHSHTVKKAMQAAQAEADSLPNGERQFALGWGRVVVKVLATVNFPTAGAVIGPINLDDLPQRVCDASDIDVGLRSDLPPRQRATVLAIAALYRERDVSFIYMPLLEIGAALLKCIIALAAKLRNHP